MLQRNNNDQMNVSRVLLLTVIILSAINQIRTLPVYAENALEYVVVTDETTQNRSENSADVFQVEIIKIETAPSEQSTKRVLIYHSHTYEAYEQDGNAPYVQTEKWRTKDERYNMIAVGKALAVNLRALGIEVVHDTTEFEPPSLDQAYDRSLQMLERRCQSGEEYDLIIDLHRDAVASTSNIMRTVRIAGNDVARFMVLVGKGETGGYTEKPNWKANLEIATKITEALNSQQESLARNVKIKTGRFNQHIDDCCILIECGMNTNTLSEVIEGLPYLAEAIAATLAQ